MRLDARVHPHARWYHVYHAELMQFLKNVVWADEESAQYGQYANAPRSFEIEVRQARRIAIITAIRLVIVNPIGDNKQIVREANEALA
jgi:hypothetical protein